LPEINNPTIGSDDSVKIELSLFEQRAPAKSDDPSGRQKSNKPEKRKAAKDRDTEYSIIISGNLPSELDIMVIKPGT